MKGNNNALRTVEPLAAIRKHPAAAMLGGVLTAIIFGTMGAVAEGGMVGAVMALLGAVIGAPGAAHVAEAAEPDRMP
jgi:hypothetical protein